jgi:adenosylhomocysteine nucleosidase
VALLLVAAEPRELEGVLRGCRGVHSLDWPIWFARGGELNRRPVALVANGPGFELAGRAVEAALERMEADAVISTGFCGALDPGLRAGQVFVAEVVAGEGKEYAVCLPQAMRGFRSGKLASRDRVLVSAAEKRELAASGAAAVDMESAAIAERACGAGRPFYAVRVVFDCAAEGFGLDFNRLRGPEGRFSWWKICRAALRRPLSGVPELIRLERRGRLAARALGEFIGDCRF